MLVGLVMLVVGLFVRGPQGAALLGTGLALGALAGLELSIREHFGGYRSHTALLAERGGGRHAGAASSTCSRTCCRPRLGSSWRRSSARLPRYGLARAFRARAGRTVKLR